MKEPVVVVGIGELGRILASGLLRVGHPVYPVTREMDVDRESTLIPGPEMVLVSVGEKDLGPVLDRLPEAWRDRVCLPQSEILPHQWREHRIVRPTVLSVWFEKKRGADLRVNLPSLVYGPKAGLILSALGSLDVQTVEVTDAAEMLHELVRKNLFVLTANVVTTLTQCKVGQLWTEQRALCREVASEALDVLEWLVRETLPREKLIGGMIEAFLADPDHECTLRVARDRLGRSLRVADEAGLAVPRLRRIRAEERFL